MERGKFKDRLTPLHKLELNHSPTTAKRSTRNFLPSHPVSHTKKRKPPTLESLCIGVVGMHLEDIMDDLPDIAFTFPSDIKMKLVAIAKRKKLLNDDVIVALAESSWEILDLCGSDISDVGLAHVVNTCKSLRAVDISHCDKLTMNGVCELLQYCQSLETLRWGGGPASERTARRCSSMLKPRLHDLAGESWEELDVMEIATGAHSLRWLVWPNIDKDSLDCLSEECPRIIVNPKPSPLGYRGVEVPREALPNILLDDPTIQDIDPNTWSRQGFIRSVTQSASDSDDLPMAEKFRLAFLERDTRLAPKRAKNARQRERRAGREWLMMSPRAKAMALASQASKSLNLRS